MSRREYNLKTPLSKGQLTELRAGDLVYLSGTLFTARDKAHQKIVSYIKSGHPIPFELNGSIIYYAGPSPTPPGKITGSIGPTTSMRMDKYTAFLLDSGLRCMIGKGPRTEQLKQLMLKKEAVYFVTIGGASAYLSKKIVSSEVIALPELGPEAIYKLVVKNFPCFVAIDTAGNDLFQNYHPRS